MGAEGHQRATGASSRRAADVAATRAPGSRISRKVRQPKSCAERGRRQIIPEPDAAETDRGAGRARDQARKNPPKSTATFSVTGRPWARSRSSRGRGCHTWPMALHLNDAIQGAGLGDNVTSLWSFGGCAKRGAARRLVLSYAVSLRSLACRCAAHAYRAAAFVGATMLSGSEPPRSTDAHRLGLSNGATPMPGVAADGRRLAALLAGALFLLAPPLLARRWGTSTSSRVDARARVWLMVRLW